MHGIPFNSVNQNYVTLDHFKEDLHHFWFENLAKKFFSDKTTCLAFKGGTIERDLLTCLGIPSFDIGGEPVCPLCCCVRGLAVVLCVLYPMYAQEAPAPQSEDAAAFDCDNIQPRSMGPS